MKNPGLAKKVNDLYLIEKKKAYPKVSQGFNQYTKVGALTPKGGKNKESKISIEFPLEKLSETIKIKVEELLRNVSIDFPAIEKEKNKVDEDEEEDYPLSQDYPTLSQATGRETIKSCKLCDFQSRHQARMSSHEEN